MARLLRSVIDVRDYAVVHCPRSRRDPVGPAWVLALDGQNVPLGMLHSRDVADEAERRIDMVMATRHHDAHVRAYRTDLADRLADERADADRWLEQRAWERECDERAEAHQTDVFGAFLERAPY